MSRRQKQRQSRQGISQTKSRLWPKVLGGLLVLILIVFLSAWMAFRNYLTSDSFRKMVESELGKAVKGEVRLNSLVWDGFHVSTNDLSLEGQSGAWEFVDLQTSLDFGAAWREKVWRLPKMEIARVVGELDLRPSASSQKRTSQPRSSSAQQQKKAFEFLPQRSELLEIFLDDFSATVQSQAGLFAWNQTQLHAELGGQDRLLRLSGGEWTFPVAWLGEMTLREGVLREKSEDWVIEQSDWTLSEAGELSAAGSFSNDGKVLLEGDFEEILATRFLSRTWKKKLSGDLQGTWRFAQSAHEGPSVAGQILLEEGTLQGLAFLDRLAAYAGSRRLKRLVFSEAQTQFSWTPEEWTLQDLVLENSGLIRLEGDLTVRGENLDGRFEVGVPPGLLAHLPGAEEKIFLARDNGGLLWTSVHVTGTFEKPQEDLSERMILAAGERMFELIPETSQWALKYGVETLDEGTQAILSHQGIVLKQGTQVIESAVESGTDLLEEGLKTGSGLFDGIFGGSSEKEN